jgi:hypothetical protein
MHCYMINGRYVDAELFAETISNLFAQGWVLAPPSCPVEKPGARAPDETGQEDTVHPDGG